MVLSAGCLYLATSHTRPWDHGAELAPAAAAGQPSPQDIGVALWCSAGCCSSWETSHVPAKEAQGTLLLQEDLVTPPKQQQHCKEVFRATIKKVWVLYLC